MKIFRKLAFLLAFAALSVNFAYSQTTAQPRQEKLLNGLKILIWHEPKTEKVSLRLRIHSGSAFDPKDKMGVMALLGESLFPDEQTKIFFREDLEGSLDVESNYDYIQINATGNASEFLSMLETLATAVSNPPLTPENFAKVREARLKRVEGLQKNAVYIADTAVAKRLLGDFPYGRPSEGTPESLKVIDRADLLFAKERFLTADNATLVISGNVKPDFAYMAARRLFGAWAKADKRIPATFRQPDDPNTEIQKIPVKDIDKELARYAHNALARNDKDYFAFVVLSKILNSRMSKFSDGFFRYEPHLLRGLAIWGISFTGADKEDKTEAVEEDKKVIRQEEFEKAKTELMNEIAKRNAADFWLDIDTYKLVSVKDELQKAEKVTLADVQRVFENFRKEPYVTIWIEKQEAEQTEEDKQEAEQTEEDKQ